MSERAPRFEPPLPSANSRFFPKRDDRYCPLSSASAPETVYQKYLASAIFGSTHPADERILHFSNKPKTVKHPLRSPTETPRHPTCRMGQVHSAEGLPDDYYSQALDYNRSNDCTAVILDGSVVLTKGDRAHTPTLPSKNARSVAFSADGQALLVGLQDGGLIGYNLAFNADGIDSHIACQNNLSSPCNQILISDSAIFIGTQQGTIARINKSNILQVEKYSHFGTSPITGLALSPDGKWLVAADNDGIFYLFDPNCPEPIQTAKRFDSGVKALAFSPCGRFLAAGGGNDDPYVTLFAIRDGTIAEIISHYTSSQTTALFWLNDFLFSTHRDGHIRTFSVAPNNLHPLSAPQMHEIPVHGNKLSYAALKRRDPSRVALLVGCSRTGQMFEVNLQMPRSPEKTSDFSRYNGIR